MRLISELITERDMLDFSQGFNVQRSYTAPACSPIARRSTSRPSTRAWPRTATCPPLP
jgi:hypothetical protein